MPAPDDDRLALASILEHLEALASRLGGGASTAHVRRSVQELSEALSAGGPVGPAVERVMASIRQLRGEDGAGPRRHQLAAEPGIARLLSTLEQELLPALQRRGRL